MTRDISHNLICLALLILAGTTMAASPGELTRDPFQPPAAFSLAPGGVVTNSANTGNEFRVTGILLAGDQALVSVGGKVLSPGEEANGYVLLEVAEDYAVFQRGDEVITLNLYPEKDDETSER